MRDLIPQPRYQIRQRDSDNPINEDLWKTADDAECAISEWMLDQDEFGVYDTREETYIDEEEF